MAGQSDDVVYQGTAAAAAAVGISKSRVVRLIRSGKLSAQRGAPGGRGRVSGGRPPLLIRRGDLLAAVGQAESPAPRPRGLLGRLRRRRQSYRPDIP